MSLDEAYRGFRRRTGSFVRTRAAIAASPRAWPVPPTKAERARRVRDASTGQPFDSATDPPSEGRASRPRYETRTAAARRRPGSRSSAAPPPIASTRGSRERGAIRTGIFRLRRGTRRRSPRPLASAPVLRAVMADRAGPTGAHQRSAFRIPREAWHGVHRPHHPSRDDLLADERRRGPLEIPDRLVDTRRPQPSRADLRCDGRQNVRPRRRSRAPPCGDIGVSDRPRRSGHEARASRAEAQPKVQRPTRRGSIRGSPRRCPVSNASTGTTFPRPATGRIRRCSRLVEAPAFTVR
ncbi:MAG: hypothetical protein KatS3mg117_2472 [Geminicoccaceae bacterium]|nr:MAG: hypothetical protein KatS3mg117_2472 [Geminicoccaceae bacterium]